MGRGKERIFDARLPKPITHLLERMMGFANCAEGPRTLLYPSYDLKKPIVMSSPKMMGFAKST
jgi:hypothetical protein